MNKIFFIINPYSGNKRSQRFIPFLKSFMKDNNLSFDYAIIANPKLIKEQAKEANQKGYQIIVAVGGDGTINQVANGFFDQEGKLLSNSLLAAIHTGTSPDFCKSYKIPTNPKSAIKLLLNGNVQKIKVGKIDFYKDQSVKIFLCATNIGIGANISQKVNLGIRKYLGDKLGTLIATLISLKNYQATDFNIIKQGKKIKITNLINLTIGITPFIASGIKVHNNYCIDNQFYCLTIKQLKIKQILPTLKILYRGKIIPKKNYLTIDYADNLIIEENKNNLVECDGDYVGCLPCKISFAKDYLKILSYDK